MTDRPSLWRNPLSIAGAWITTLSAFAFIVYFITESLGLLDNPYSGLFGFIGVPAVFLIGLLLIPIGIWREGRRRKRGRAPWSWPTINLAHTRTQQVIIGVLALTVVNLAIVGVAGFSASHYMETDQFCGQVCHEPMKPEFTAHLSPPHAAVGCVRCHVAPGAAGVVRAKMNGARQAFLFVGGRYARPIATPVHNIPAGADTCARCHTAGHPSRDVTRVIKEYADDEANTETVTTLVMLTGAIHWHARPDIRVEYASDPKRETIPYIKVTDAAGQVTEYFADGTSAAPAGSLRRMDCLDCHSRPAHVMSASAARTVDNAIAAGQISAALPFVRREAVAALEAPYADEAAASAGIRQRIGDFYRSQPAAPAAEVAKAIETLERLYRSNVFPAMKVSWGTYRSQLGHSDATPGCFRCHDDAHKSRAGKAISQECETCHKGT